MKRGRESNGSKARHHKLRNARLCSSACIRPCPHADASLSHRRRRRRLLLLLLDASPTRLACVHFLQATTFRGVRAYGRDSPSQCSHLRRCVGDARSDPGRRPRHSSFAPSANQILPIQSDSWPRFEDSVLNWLLFQHKVDKASLGYQFASPARCKNTFRGSLLCDDRPLRMCAAATAQRLPYSQGASSRSSPLPIA